MTASSTIAAVATGGAPGGIGVVRVSGPAALEAARAVASALPASPAPRHAYFTPLVDEAGRVLDEGLALYFAAPASFTGEDVVELHAHGAPRLMSLLLDTVLRHPAVRPAEAGEFTRRAFLNGRLDLARAEAVADLVAAESEAQVRAAAAQLTGQLSARLAAARQPLVALHADLEGVLDFPEEAEGADVDVAPRLAAARLDVERLLVDGRAGVLVRRGARVVLYGPVNAGKSTLFNRLAGANRALVDAEPGTTRDVLEARLELEGLAVTLVDTAGLRGEPGRLEAMGIARAREALAGADVAVLLVPPEASADEVAAWRAEAPDAVRLEVISKADLINPPPGAPSSREGARVAGPASGPRATPDETEVRPASAAVAGARVAGPTSGRRAAPDETEARESAAGERVRVAEPASRRKAAPRETEESAVAAEGERVAEPASGRRAAPDETEARESAAAGGVRVAEPASGGRATPDETQALPAPAVVEGARVAGPAVGRMAAPREAEESASAAEGVRVAEPASGRRGSPDEAEARESAAAGGERVAEPASGGRATPDETEALPAPAVVESARVAGPASGRMAARKETEARESAAAGEGVQVAGPRQTAVAVQAVRVDGAASARMAVTGEPEFTDTPGLERLRVDAARSGTASRPLEAGRPAASEERPPIDREPSGETGAGPLRVSGETGLGVAALQSALVARLGGGVAGAVRVTSERHLDALRRAAEALERAEVAVTASTLEVVSGEVGLALAALADITGEDVSSELLDAIFARFCIGK